MAKKAKKQVSIIRSGPGSIKYIQQHHNKGIFWSPDLPDGKVILIDNLSNPNKEIIFDDMTDFENYVKDTY